MVTGGRGGFSGIDPQQLWDLIGSITNRTGQSGGGAQPVVGSWLDQSARIGLDTTEPAAIGRHLAWAQGQLPILRQRHHLAVLAGRPYPGGTRHMVQISDAAVDVSSPAETARDAREALHLARTDPGDLSNAQLTRLRALLNRHKNNPLFAENFASTLGASATLTFYTALTAVRQYETEPRDTTGLDPETAARMSQLGDLEQALGATLATASRSDDAATRRWQQDVIALGAEDVGDSPNDVYGFQAMSSLLRHGEYDSGFLGRYGAALLAFERSHITDEHVGLQDQVSRKNVLPWDLTGHRVRLHYGTVDDNGADPLTGFMEALGHNPAASTAFLSAKPHFDYLTRTRIWPADPPTDEATIAGYRALGHALESATMGAAYDASPPQLHRTAATAAVMAAVVSMYGRRAEGTDTARTGVSGAGLLARQTGIGKSLGRMTAAYIDDVDWGLYDTTDGNSIFSRVNGRENQLERARFNGDSLRRFLGTISHDDDAYRTVTNAQQAYTTSALVAHPAGRSAYGEPEFSDAKGAIRIGAELQGIMDRSWADQFTATKVASEQDFNDQLDKRAETQQKIAGLLTAGVFAFAPAPEDGLGATIIPLATDQSKGEMDGRIQQSISNYAESQHRELADVRQGQTARFYDAGRAASLLPVHRFLDDPRYNTWTSEQQSKLSEELHEAQQTGYNAGSLNQQLSGNLPVT
ncbi:hypothetical protein [Streptomyces sp. CA-111067]|uniref:hypothetical protein n=1 Tax=Streptomyces sp. CA-111067 TaxID=3240046 RepID=UPI003D982909